MGIIDKIATVVADKINAKNDEVMSLTQENEKLSYELNKLGEELRMSESERKKWEKLCYKQAENLQDKVMENKELNSELTRIKNNYKELSKIKPDKRLKQRIKELEEQLDQSEKMRKLNYSLSEAKSFVADKKNKDKLIECLSHNLKLYADENELTFSELGEAYEVSKETARRIYSGERGTSVTTFELMESDMCAYFDCMPLDLVTKKAEGKEC